RPSSPRTRTAVRRSRNALLAPLQGEGRGGDGVQRVSTCRRGNAGKSTPSPPNLPLEGRALVTRPMREDVCPDASRQSGGSTPLPCVVVRVAACREVLRTAVRERGDPGTLTFNA